MNCCEFYNSPEKLVTVYQKFASRTESYEYDAMGNRTVERILLRNEYGYTYTYYPNSNRLQSKEKQDGTERIDYAYDENGNLISKVVTKGEKVDHWEYAYDLFNQLEQVKKNGEVVSTYIYDPNGFRVEKVGSKGKIHYVPLLNGEVGYRKEFATNMEYSFIYVGIQHLARVNGVIGGSGKKFYYHNDHLGSALAVTDEYGNKVVERDFTPFGERINTDVYDDEPRDLEEDESGFTGKDWDEDVGLYYYNARWYDPTIGRFISEDSVADDPNLYGYCFNNPINNIDPSGHFSVGLQSGWGLVGATVNAVAILSGDSKLSVAISCFNMFIAIKTSIQIAQIKQAITEAAKTDQPAPDPVETVENASTTEGEVDSDQREAVNDTKQSSDKVSSDSTNSNNPTNSITNPSSNGTSNTSTTIINETEPIDTEIPEESKPDVDELINELIKKRASQDQIRAKIKKYALEMIEKGAIYANDDEPFDPKPPTMNYADCSGSLFVCYTKAGVKIKRLSAEQYYKLAKKIHITELQVGDAVAWYNPTTKKWGHIQIYLGEVTIGNRIIKDAILNAPGHFETGEGKPLYIESLATYTRWMQAPKYKWEPAYLDLLTALNY